MTTPTVEGASFKRCSAACSSLNNIISLYTDDESSDSNARHTRLKGNNQRTSLLEMR